MLGPCNNPTTCVLLLAPGYDERRKELKHPAKTPATKWHSSVTGQDGEELRCRPHTLAMRTMGPRPWRAAQASVLREGEGEVAVWEFGDLDSFGDSLTNTISLWRDQGRQEQGSGAKQNGFKSHLPPTSWVTWRVISILLGISVRICKMDIPRCPAQAVVRSHLHSQARRCGRSPLHGAALHWNGRGGSYEERLPPRARAGGGGGGTGATREP